MADNNRRVGDWQHKDLRKDANTIVGEEDQPKLWFQRTFWIIFFLIVFWPAGIVFTWRSGWPVVAKVVATLLLIAVIYLAYSMSQAVQGLS